MFCFYCCHRSTLRWTFLLSLPLSLINPRVNSILLHFTVKIPINQPQGGLALHLLLLPLIKPKDGLLLLSFCHCSVLRWLCCCHCCRCSILSWALLGHCCHSSCCHCSILRCSLLLSLLVLFNPKVGSAVTVVKS